MSNTYVLNLSILAVSSGGAGSNGGFVITLRRFVWVVVANFLFAGVLLQKLSTRLYLGGKIPEYCNGTVIHALHDWFTFYQADDSWTPMLRALRFANSPQGIYQAVFFDQNTKFQYPLTSLIPFWVLQRAGMDESHLLLLLKVLSVLAVLATAWVAMVIALKSFDKLTFKDGKNTRVILAVTILFVSITFYPLIKSYALGQIQLFINLLFCVAFLCWLTSRDRWAGAVIGVITLVKPQYALILLWGVLRKRWGFFCSGIACTVIGLVGSVALFGLSNNIQYLGVLSFLSRRGEAFFANQTFNGLFNRLAGNGANTEFLIHGFPEYRPAIYFATIMSSLALLAWAVPFCLAASVRNRILDFSLAAIVATAASPIAWEHHYGILLPILAWQIGRFVTGEELSRVQSWLFCAIYILVADDLRITALWAHSKMNVIESYLFFGVLLLIGLLKSELKPRVAGEQAAPLDRPAFLPRPKFAIDQQAS